ncbi:MAG: hypothetical protein NC548_46390 [Lachnospiraceae bacterium]|nr:hypothetical protein [Lachnospiraceae bacterium]
MSGFDEMLKRADFCELVQFIMYGMNDDSDFDVDYERRVEHSLDKILGTLESAYPDLNRNDPVLLGAISDFEVAHDEAYFRRGIITGIKIYRSIKESFSGNEERLFHVNTTANRRE